MREERVYIVSALSQRCAILFELSNETSRIFWNLDEEDFIDGSAWSIDFCFTGSISTEGEGTGGLLFTFCEGEVLDEDVKVASDFYWFSGLWFFLHIQILYCYKNHDCSRSLESYWRGASSAAG